MEEPRSPLATLPQIHSPTPSLVLPMGCGSPFFSRSFNPDATSGVDGLQALGQGSFSKNQSNVQGLVRTCSSKVETAFAQNLKQPESLNGWFPAPSDLGTDFPPLAWLRPWQA